MYDWLECQQMSTHPAVYQLKVVLREISPMIVRRFLIRHDMTLFDLHHTLQVVMGWENYHLYEFKVQGNAYGRGGASMSDHDVTLSEFDFRVKDIFVYTYDFGDGWEHDLRVEKKPRFEAGGAYPRCLSGKRACPPEDCGGPWAYQDLLAVLKDRSHPDYRELKAWVGRSFKPEAFDLSEVNEQLKDHFPA